MLFLRGMARSGKLRVALPLAVMRGMEAGMTTTENPLAGWVPPQRPGPLTKAGRYVGLHPLSAEHVPALYAVNSVDDAIWDYLFCGPFPTESDYGQWVEGAVAANDPCYHCVTDLATGQPGGVASLMRIDPGAGSVEVGGICFAPVLQRTRAASEAIYLFAEHVFSLGYRRFEWKCNALNIPSRRAAQRFGFLLRACFAITWWSRDATGTRPGLP